jgi:hypothetical protein
VGLIVVFDPHRKHVEENQHKYCYFEAARVRQVVEHGQELVHRTLDHLLGLLPAELFHRRVVVLLAFGEEHLEDAALVLKRTI